MAILGTAAVACEPSSSRPQVPPRCPPPPEPTHVSAVVGTIGKLHLVESRYPLTRLGDVLSGFQPDLVLLGVRSDAFHEDRLEDASFEMTYVRHLARTHGVAVEPVDWFRDEEIGAAEAKAEPWDAVEVARREAEVLSLPRLYTFDRANGDDLLAQTFLAANAQAKNRGGNPIASRRRAWLSTLVAGAVMRHDRPRRVLAYVDVLDRHDVDATLRILGYTARTPIEIVRGAKEVMVPDVPPEVIADYREQLPRARERAAKASGPEKVFWAERVRVLEVAIERKASCCVTQAAVSPR